MDEGGANPVASFVPHRRKAAMVLLVVTLVWGATFIWMKQALNALEVEIETFGTFPVVAFLVALRFSIAMVLVLIAFPKTVAGLTSAPVWKGGGILGGLMLIGFVSQMVALNDINPSTSAFLTSLYVVMTALLTVRLSQHPPRRALYWGVFMATIGAGFIEGPPHLSWGAGELITVLCALFFALHIIFTQKLTSELDPLMLTLTSFIVVAGGSLLLTLGSSGDSFTMMSDVVRRDGVMQPIFLLGLGGSFFCLVALNMFQRHMHPVQAAIIYAFEPVWATLFGLGLGLVDWTWWIPFGGGVLLVGNIIVEITSPNEETESTLQEAE
ncbi:MAG: DMT family transporter [Candidatus Thermoplasmatota archaeon]|nr:DMT family transporter [Candidatus Thermoplasmatota archaeon]GIR75413.1 MAG: membrane protein [Candidatus Poseidoniales archaeon]